MAASDESPGVLQRRRGAVVKLAHAVLNLIFPPLCMACRTPISEAHNLCAECWREIVFFDGAVCDCCGFPFEFAPGGDARCAACQARPPAFDRARALMRYDDASKRTILALKRADRLDLVPAFARMLERAGRELLAETDIVLPVPLHRTRLWTRRFNQSALIAQRLAKLSSKPMDATILVRVRATPSQGDMPSAKARRRNVRGAFQVRSERTAVLKGRTVLLIDDVFTTGATIESCARAVKKAGAARVLVLTLARVVRPIAL
jgi:ComF family protein